ncbi:hypothetical protein Ahy_B02g057852 isoform A [Arachis hypogaea]|uniref:RBR-type E3 ubiquitin transferase n=1 Tax=Arachis hypogaea TaxID=3818 RepID=A0A445ADB2_ARAHY|nr:hypothetical protein Ahy_B02g057852 isoform A [Arachis hypogaea]
MEKRKFEEEAYGGEAPAQEAESPNPIQAVLLQCKRYSCIEIVKKVLGGKDDLEFANGDVDGIESLIYTDNAMPSYPNGEDMKVEVDMPDVVIESSNTSLDDLINKNHSYLHDLQVVLCAICMDSKPFQEIFINQNCNHSFCDECIAKYVAAKIQENISNVKCPEPKCREILEPQNCMSIIPKEVFERWENALCENLVLATSKKFYCSFKDCSTMLVNDDGNEVVTCSEYPNCHRLFCAQCKIAWHGGMECGEFMGLNENEREKEDLMVMNLAKDKRWRRCSKCRFYVKKN